MGKNIRGNICIFCLFQICNISLFFIGAGTCASGVYICVKASSFTWYNGGFVGLGFFTFLLGIVGCKTKYSAFWMSFYSLGIFACLAGQVGITVGVIVFDKFSNDVGSENGKIQEYVLGTACLLMLLAFVTSVCYCLSLKNNTANDVSNYAELKAPEKKEIGQERTSKYGEIRARRE